MSDLREYFIRKGYRVGILLRKKAGSSFSPSPECPVEITAELSDNDYYITCDHEMTKKHYIAFAALVKKRQSIFCKALSRTKPVFQTPGGQGGARLYLYCVKHGLTKIDRVI